MEIEPNQTNSHAGVLTKDPAYLLPLKRHPGHLLRHPGHLLRKAGLDVTETPVTCYENPGLLLRIKHNFTLSLPLPLPEGGGVGQGHAEACPALPGSQPTLAGVA